MKTKNKILFSFIAGVFFSSTIMMQPSFAASSAVALDRIVAIVNDSVITSRQLNQQVEMAKQQLMANQQPLPQHLQKKVLKQMIDVKLQLQLAKNAHFVADDASVDRAIAAIAKDHKMTVPQLRAALVQQKIDYKKYREEIRDEMTVSQLEQKEVGPKITVSDAEVELLAKTLQKGSHPRHKQAAMDQARQMIFRRKFAAAVEDWLRELRAGAYVKILLHPQS